MKRHDIQKCGLCGKGIAHNGLPFFYVIEIQRFCLNKQAIHEQAGLEMFFGGGSQGAMLADVMGANSDIAKPINEEKGKLWICEDCSTNNRTLVAILAENGG
jgi:hypothetical protein